MEVAKRSYGVDVSSFQGVDLSAMAKAGANFAIVKASEGTGYQNPKAPAQVNSANANGIMVSGYHYAHFSASRSQAVLGRKSLLSMGLAYGLHLISTIVVYVKTPQTLDTFHPWIT